MSTPQHTDQRPIRVVHLIDNLSSRGGAQQSIALLAPVIGGHGVDLVVVHLDDAADLSEGLRERGVDVRAVTGRGGRVADVVRMTKFLRAERPDLLHTSLHAANMVGRFAARFARVPVVTSIVSTKTDAGRADRHSTWGRAKSWASVALARVTSGMVRRVHAVSASVAIQANEGLGHSADLIDVVARGRDGSTLGVRSPEQRQAVRTAEGIAPDAVVVLVVGRHYPEKAFDVMIDAVPLLLPDVPSLHLLVAGRDGPESARLRAQCEQLDIVERVHFLGHRDDVAALHSAADVFVLCSRLEGMPGVLIEALAMRTPAVVTDIGPALDVIDATCAVIVPVEATVELAKGILRVLTDATATEERVLAGRRRFEERFELDVVAAQMAAFYRRALAHP